MSNENTEQMLKERLKKLYCWSLVNYLFDEEMTAKIMDRSSFNGLLKANNVPEYANHLRKLVIATDEMRNSRDDE